jgi:hypothetical protein
MGPTATRKPTRASASFTPDLNPDGGAREIDKLSSSLRLVGAFQAAMSPVKRISSCSPECSSHPSGDRPGRFHQYQADFDKVLYLPSSFFLRVSM